VYLDRHLRDASPVTTKREPFDALDERPKMEKSRGDWRLFEPLVADFIDATLADDLIPRLVAHLRFAG
jgi:hypothetical protein